MAEAEKSKDITPQEDAVTEIEEREFESVDELEAFTEGDDRQKVADAIAAKLKEDFGYDPDEEPSDAETVAVVEVPFADFQQIKQAVAEKVTMDQERRGLSQPAPVDKALIEAREKLDAIADA